MRYLSRLVSDYLLCRDESLRSQNRQSRTERALCSGQEIWVNSVWARTSWKKSRVRSYTPGEGCSTI